MPRLNITKTRHPSQISKRQKKHLKLWIIVIGILFSASMLLSAATNVFYDREWQVQSLGSQERLAEYIGIMDFMDDKTDMLPKALSADEQSHLFDVKILVKRLAAFSIITWVLSAASVILFFFMHSRKHWLYWIQEVLLGMWSALAALLALLGIGALMFSGFFTLFHEAFFPQGNWEFSADSVLIQLFPESFFAEGLGRILLGLAIALTVIVVLDVAAYLLRRHFSEEA